MDKTEREDCNTRTFHHLRGNMNIGIVEAGIDGMLEDFVQNGVVTAGRLVHPGESIGRYLLAFLLHLEPFDSKSKRSKHTGFVGTKEDLPKPCVFSTSLIVLFISLS